MKHYLIIWLSIVTILFSISACSKKINEDTKQDVSVNKEENGDSKKTEDVKKLTIYSLWDNVTVREAINRYQVKHSNIKIDYKVAMTDGDGATQSDLVRVLNTEVLAGNGPDIFLMDGLPLSSYIQKGVLMDMGDIFEEDIQSKSILNNVTDYYHKDGKIYCMPLRVYMPLYAMSENFSYAADSMENLASYCEKLDKPLLEPLAYNKFVPMFLYTYSTEIFNSEGLIDHDKLISFISNMQKIANQSGAKVDGYIPEPIREDGIQGSNARMRSIFCGDGLNIINGDIDASITITGDVSDLSFLDYSVKQKNSIYYPMNKTFIPNGLIGINQKTKVPDVAKDFVSYLFSDDMTSWNLNDGFSINENSLRKWVNNEEQEGNVLGFSYIDEKNEKKYVEFGFASNADKQKAVDTLTTLTQPIYNDSYVIQMISDGIVDYLSNQKMLEETAQEIEGKVNLYLQE